MAASVAGASPSWDTASHAWSPHDGDGGPAARGRAGDGAAGGAEAQPLSWPDQLLPAGLREPWAKELAARTNGAVKVEIFNATSPFGKVTEQATHVKDGKVDIALGLRGAEGDRFPAARSSSCRSWCRTRSRIAGAVGSLQGRHAGRRIQGLQGARAVRAQSGPDPHQGQARRRPGRHQGRCGCARPTRRSRRRSTRRRRAGGAAGERRHAGREGRHASTASSPTGAIHCRASTIT